MQPYEEAKIRVLNATHNCIAWAGTLVGYSFIHEGSLDPTIRQLAFDYVTDDVMPVLDTPEQPCPINLAHSATWCWTGSATPPFKTPTNVLPWMDSARFRAS